MEEPVTKFPWPYKQPYFWDNVNAARHVRDVYLMAALHSEKRSVRSFEAFFFHPD